MGRLVFKLKSVPEEEADGVRRALEAAGVQFYETSGGLLGWSLPGIWVKHDGDYRLAREAIDSFQEEYVRKIREEQLPKQRMGIWRLAILIVLCAIVLYVSNSFWLHL